MNTNIDILAVNPQMSWDLSALNLVCPSDIVCVGDLYVIVDQYTHKLYFLDQKMSLLKTVGSEGDKKFYYPRNICVDDDKTLWLTDSWNHCVKRIDLDGNIVGGFGRYGKKNGEFSEPWGISFFNGEIIVSDRNNHRIQIFNKNGEFIRQFGSSGPEREYFESDKFKTGFIYEYWRKSASRFCTVETYFRKDGYKFGTMEYPLNVSVSEKGEIVVIDSGNDRVQRFSYGGELISSFKRRDDLDFFTDAVYLNNDLLLISGEVSDNIFVVNKNNDVIGKISVCGAKLNYMWIENKNTVLTLDSWNKKLYKFLWK